MASRKLSLEEVMALLGGEEEDSVEEDVDDSQEVIMEGSDEEFDVLDESENGIYNNGCDASVYECFIHR